MPLRYGSALCLIALSFVRYGHLRYASLRYVFLTMPTCVMVVCAMAICVMPVCVMPFCVMPLCVIPQRDGHLQNWLVAIQLWIDTFMFWTILFQILIIEICHRYTSIFMTSSFPRRNDTQRLPYMKV